MSEWDDSVVGDTPENATAGLRGGNYGGSSKQLFPPACAESDGMRKQILFRSLGASIGFRCCGD
ncbi:MAG: hypothetical protein IT374_25415 [Polyangiaceae bacterium]|nr:hypothetical protein [Polyangiaceae bacterium]